MPWELFQAMDCSPWPSRLGVSCARVGTGLGVGSAPSQGTKEVPPDNSTEGTLPRGALRPLPHFSRPLPSVGCGWDQQDSDTAARHGMGGKCQGKRGITQGVQMGGKGWEKTYGKGKSQCEREENALPWSCAAREDPWAVLQPLCLSHLKWVGKNPWKMSCEEQPCTAGAAEPSAPKGIFHLLIYGTWKVVWFGLAPLQGVMPSWQYLLWTPEERILEEIRCALRKGPGEPRNGAGSSSCWRVTNVLQHHHHHHHHRMG